MTTNHQLSLRWFFFYILRTYVYVCVCVHVHSANLFRNDVKRILNAINLCSSNLNAFVHLHQNREYIPHDKHRGEMWEGHEHVRCDLCNCKSNSMKIEEKIKLRMKCVPKAIYLPFFVFTQLWKYVVEMTHLFIYPIQQHIRYMCNCWFWLFVDFFISCGTHWMFIVCANFNAVYLFCWN